MSKIDELGKDRWQTLSALLDDALDLDDTERAQWLAALRIRDPDMAAELARFLDARNAIDQKGFLAVSPSMAAAALAGQAVGAWVLESAIGQGGMGSVWLASRADDRFEGKAAVKLLNMSLIGHDGERRFRREGTILASLAHPHIARLLDAGIAETGQPYLILEYVSGQHIDAYCDKKNLDIDARVRLFLDVLAAVAHAHTNLIVHRDLKPSNVLVADDGVVKLLDFGIAKLIIDDATPHVNGATAITREGGNALTPEYAAPEQLLGQPITTSTDVYSLGVLLYLLLGGQHPNGNTNLPPAELVKAIVETAPPLVSDAVSQTKTIPLETLGKNAAHRAATTEKLKRLLRGDLDNIVAKALKKNPSERYASVNAFADDLRKYLEHEPVTARPDSFGYRASKFVRRHRGGVAAGLLTMVAVSAGVVGTIWQAQRANEQARIAQRERDSALRELTLANGAKDLVGILVAQSADKPLLATELLARAEQTIDQQYADSDYTRGSLQLMIGVAYGNTLDLKKAEAVFMRVRNTADRLNDVRLRTSADCLLAAAYRDRGELTRARALFDVAMPQYEKVANKQDSVMANCLYDRAIMNAFSGNAKAMLADAEAAVTYLGSGDSSDRTLANIVRVAVADAHGRLGHFSIAIKGYETSIADLESMGRLKTSEGSTRLNNFSVMLLRAGQVQRAASMSQKALEISDGIGSPDGMRVVLQGNYARALIFLGRYDESKQLIESGLAFSEKQNDKNRVAQHSIYGASAWCATGDLTRCQSLLEAAHANLQPILPPTHVNFANIEIWQADLSLARAMPLEASMQLKRALAIFDATSEKNAFRIYALAKLARTEQKLGQIIAARNSASDAVAAARDASKDLTATYWLGIALMAQGVVEKAQGNKSAARLAFDEALSQLRGSLGDDAPATKEARALHAEL